MLAEPPLSAQAQALQRCLVLSWRRASTSLGGPLSMCLSQQLQCGTLVKPFTRIETRNTKCIWVGWGGVITFMLTCTPTSCYARVIFSCVCTHTSCYAMVGWGGVKTFMLTCTPTSCYARVIFSCACTHTSCYAMVGWGGVITFMLTCTPTSCYARVIFSCACTHTHNMLRYGGVGWGGLDIYIHFKISIHARGWNFDALVYDNFTSSKLVTSVNIDW